MKQLLKILKNDEKVIFRIKGSNYAYITNDKLENISIDSECVKISLTFSAN